MADLSEKPEVGSGQLWLVEQCRPWAGGYTDAREAIVLIELAPDDWAGPEDSYTNRTNYTRYVRTRLYYGWRGAKPDEYILEDLHAFYTAPMVRKNWTFRLFGDHIYPIVYKRLIHTWR